MRYVSPVTLTNRFQHASRISQYMVTMVYA